MELVRETYEAWTAGCEVDNCPHLKELMGPFRLKRSAETAARRHSKLPGHKASIWRAQFEDVRARGDVECMWCNHKTTVDELVYRS